MNKSIKEYELNGLKMVRDELNKIGKKLEEKIDKEQAKVDKKYITFKGCECHTHEEVDDIYRYDMCTDSECEKAHKRLDDKLSGNSEKLDALKYADKIIGNVLYNTICEIVELEKKKEGGIDGNI